MAVEGLPGLHMVAIVTSICPNTMALKRLKSHAVPEAFTMTKPSDIHQVLMRSYANTAHRIEYLVVDTMVWCWMSMHGETKSIMGYLNASRWHTFVPDMMAQILGIKALVVVEPLTDSLAATVYA